MGRVFEGGPCESFVPGFHQRVQIWRLLLLLSRVLKTHQRPGRKRERKGAGVWVYRGEKKRKKEERELWERDLNETAGKDRS